MSHHRAHGPRGGEFLTGNMREFNRDHAPASSSARAFYGDVVRTRFLRPRQFLFHPEQIEYGASSAAELRQELCCIARPLPSPRRNGLVTTRATSGAGSEARAARFHRERVAATACDGGVRERMSRVVKRAGQTVEAQVMPRPDASYRVAALQRRLSSDAREIARARIAGIVGVHAAAACAVLLDNRLRRRGSPLLLAADR